MTLSFLCLTNDDEGLALMLPGRARIIEALLWVAQECGDKGPWNGHCKLA